MRRAPLFIGAAVIVFGMVTSLKARITPQTAATDRIAVDDGYLGSESCRSCHEDQYVSWKKSLHVQMTRPVEDARVLGDFHPGTRFEKYGRSYLMDTRGGRRFVKVSRAGTAASVREEEYEVHYTLGARRFQGYLSRLPDGRIYVLPVFWHTETGQWIDYKEITPLPPDALDARHDFRQIWNVNCFNCHATNLAQNFDTSTKTYRTSWTEMGIGCEACHGPGREHTAIMRARQSVKDAPAMKPAELRILSPRTGSPRQIFDACGYCHGNKTNYFGDFRAGDRYEDYALPFLISQPIPPEDPQGDFWPDGRPNRFNRPQALTSSGCFLKGSVTCTSCHVGHAARHDHALKRPLEQSNGLCTQCHRDIEGPALEAHTRHRAASTGSRCIECHMSDVNWRLLTRRRDHTFAPPVPEMTAAYGVPNACTTCHDDRTPEWAIRAMDAWYGAGDRERRARAMRLAETMYRAGGGDRSAFGGLARVLSDRSYGVIVRASAADFLGRLATARGPERPAPHAAGDAAAALPLEAANALLSASADREPIVRAVSVRALGFAGERRAIPAITGRLRDPARVVRVTAAAALLALGVPRLEGPAGQALVKAQDEYAASLQAFPDSSDNHASIAWLEMSRGGDARADAALSTAIALDPANPRPRLLRGVLFARQDRLDDALREWKEVKRLDPKHPRIDLLIDEAQRRRLR
jgi:predicted CXXCH cytochrome family protein